jgi:hypothetical protein
MKSARDLNVSHSSNTNIIITTAITTEQAVDSAYFMPAALYNHIDIWRSCFLPELVGALTDLISAHALAQARGSIRSPTEQGTFWLSRGGT